MDRNFAKNISGGDLYKHKIIIYKVAILQSDILFFFTDSKFFKQLLFKQGHFNSIKLEY